LRGVPISMSAVSCAFAQPTFEVASIHPNAMMPREFHAMPDAIVTAPNGITVHGASMKTCIKWAFNIAPYQVDGPAWINTERYEIVAKAGGPTPEPELRKMLQRLLAERFKLVFHRQNKDMSVLVLLVGKNGHKMKESDGEGPSDFVPSKLGMNGRRV